MNDEWITWEEGQRIAGERFRGNGGKQWAESRKLPIMQDGKNRRVYVSRLACENLRKHRTPELSGFETQDNAMHTDPGVNSSHPEFYDINIKVMISHTMLTAILSLMEKTHERR